MKLPEQGWLKVVLLATTFVFASVAIYLYAFRFFAWVESDAAVTAVLAAKVLHAKSPVVADWYYANGDVWGVAPHLFALLPVAILGLGPASLLISVVLGFLIELVVLIKLYLRLCGELWVAMFAAMVTLMAWSSAHVAFVYIQLGYGFLMFLCMLSFSTFAALAENAPARPWRWAVAGLVVALIAVQNPMRSLAYILVPLLAGCIWPWRSLALRRRLAIAATATAGWLLAFVIYAWVFSRVVTFSAPRGHIEFVVADAAGIEGNLRMLGRGLTVLCGGGEEPSVRAIPGVLVMAGGIALVIREIVTSRAFTTMRFMCLIVVAQAGLVLVPLVIGNLLTTVGSVRYLMPSLLAMLGLASMLAVRTLREAATSWRRRLAIGWLAAVPLAAIVAMPDARPPTPQKYIWPDSAQLDKVADELVRRGLTHGFSNVLAANLLTLQTGGAAKTCPIYMRDWIVPQRWLADTSCFTASALPDRFFVVSDQQEQDRAAIRVTLPTWIERFSVGDTYEVYVYRTAETPLTWMELPLPEGKDVRFPLRIAATHLQLRHGNVVLQSEDLVATGAPGTVVYGPYMKLPRGVYELVWSGRAIESPGQIAFNVSADGGRELLAHVVVDARTLGGGRSELVRLRFKLGRMRSNLEFSVQSGGGGRVSLHELVVERKR